MRSSRDRTTVTLARGARIARHCIQLCLRYGALLVAGVDIADRRFQRGTLGSLFRYELGALALAHDHRFFSHISRYSLLLEREVERFEQRPTFLGISRRRGDRDIETTQCVNFVVINLRENDLLGDTYAVIAIAIE